MDKIEMLPNLAKAVIAVMKDVKGVEKGLTVGTGGSAYKGVSDRDVKITIGRSMAEHGLCILPIGVEPNLKIDRWEETSNYGVKQKQQVFTEVTTKYLLLHTSGESVVVMGYGHGVDSQDKSAGKATTYGLKYTLLNTFLVPTGDIDDGDSVHSDSIEVPKTQKSTPKTTPTTPKKSDSVTVETKQALPELTKTHKLYESAIKNYQDGKMTLEYIKGKFTLSKELEDEIKKLKVTKK